MDFGLSRLSYRACALSGFSLLRIWVKTAPLPERFELNYHYLKAVRHVEEILSEIKAWDDSGGSEARMLGKRLGLLRTI